jgi:DNA-binding transcriptional LysR family regulator
MDQLLNHLSQEYASAPKEVRVAVSRTIGLAYLPGFFHANLRRLPGLIYRVGSQPTDQILAALEANEQDIGVVCPPARLPKTLRVTHRFVDAFTLIAPRALLSEIQAVKTRKAQLNWLRKQNWLLLEEQSDTGGRLREWLRQSQLLITPAMQLDNFDLIISLVGLGMGISCVPIRALALYNQRRLVVRVPFPARFTRDLVVLVRKRREMPDHISGFIENVLF